MLSTQRYYQVGFATFLVLVSFAFFVFRRDEAVVYEHIARVPYRTTEPQLRSTIPALFSPIKHDPSNPNYRTSSGTTYTAPSTPWPTPLGKKILIVDIDTRSPTSPNQLLHPSPLDFSTLDTHSGGGLVSAAILNHYLYALIHGYDYQFYHAAPIPSHHATWILPHALRALIPSYQFVVALDADATIPHLDLPLEWLFNRWGIAPHTSMALPWDTEELRGGESISRDSRGLRVLNTGFVIAQNNPTTVAMLDAWRECTTETRYAGCAHWKQNWSHEQRAFSEYVRYDYNATPETIVGIPCDDAVGWPGFKKEVESGNAGISDCNGNFVRHYTLGKDKVKGAGSEAVMQALSGVLQKALLGDERLWFKEGEEREREKEGEAQSEVREKTMLEGLD